MRNRKLITIIAILLIISITSIIAYIDNKRGYPYDFDFIYSYGVDGKEGIDTSNNILKYDTYDGVIKVSFELSNKEKRMIYDKIVENEFMQLPASFPVYSSGVQPSGKSRLTVKYKGESNSVFWSTINFDLSTIISGGDPTHNNEELKKVTEIGRFIDEIIRKRIETMGLPDKPIYL